MNVLEIVIKLKIHFPVNHFKCVPIIIYYRMKKRTTFVIYNFASFYSEAFRFNSFGVYYKLLVPMRSILVCALRIAHVNATVLSTF